MIAEPIPQKICLHAKTICRLALLWVKQRFALSYKCKGNNISFLIVPNQLQHHLAFQQNWTSQNHHWNPISRTTDVNNICDYKKEIEFSVLLWNSKGKLKVGILSHSNSHELSKSRHVSCRKLDQFLSQFFSMLLFQVHTKYDENVWILNQNYFKTLILQ